MSESRTLEQITQEYQGLSLRGGHVSYQISALSEDLKEIQRAMRDLNLEAAKLKEEQAKASEQPKEA